jgi:hypothetical protein
LISIDDFCDFIRMAASSRLLLSSRWQLAPLLGASAAAAESGGPNWHVVSVSSLLPSLACTAAAEGMCKTPISYVKLTLDLVALLISISTIPSTC